MRLQHWLLLTLSAALGLAGGWLVQQQTGNDAGDDQPVTVEASSDQAADGAAGEDPIGLRRPGFTLPDLDGEPVDVARFDGNVLVINFWASWCPPCVDEVPMLIDLQADYADAGVRVIGVAVEEPEPVIDFVDRFGIDYPVVADRRAGFAAAAEYGNPEGVLPYTVFVDREGDIRGVHRGALSREQADRALRPLLDGD